MVVEPAVRVDTLDVFHEIVIAPGTGRTPAGIGKAGGMFVVRARGDRQFAIIFGDRFTL